MKDGYQCDFERGSLVVVDQKTAVRVVKDLDGALLIEGAYGKLFWRVRKAVYAMHAIV